MRGDGSACGVVGLVTRATNVSLMTDSQCRVNRWHRYGKDRLYVTKPDGRKIGWWDLIADQGHPESPHLDTALLEAVTSWRASPPDAPNQRPTHAAYLATQRSSSPATGLPAEHADESGPAPALGWDDLAATRPGAAARCQARAAKEAAPVRTFLARALGIHSEERAWRRLRSMRLRVGPPPGVRDQARRATRLIGGSPRRILTRASTDQQCGRPPRLLRKEKTARGLREG